MSEESKMLEQYELEEESFNASLRIPFFLLEDVVNQDGKNSFYSDLSFILKCYSIYEKGCNFVAEGSNGDYTPSKLRYKKASMIINKEARFCFANPPTISVNANDVEGIKAEENAVVQKYLEKVLEKNKFSSKLLKALKDCFVGKRIAIVLNFNVKCGITITFLNSLEFYYEFSDDGEELIKFVCFYEKEKTNYLDKQVWFRKYYEKTEEGVMLEEAYYDGAGNLVETITQRKKIKFESIPAVVVLNDGLTGNIYGNSELFGLAEYEKYYSKLANADMDSERKGMHPTRYTIDASEGSTKNLSTSPGSFWDIQSDEEKATEHTAKVGLIEPSMKYAEPLKMTLDRIESEMYAEVDVPNIASDKLSGIITSGKTIGALYWGLTVRCDEKMLSWEPELRYIAEMIIEGGKLYPECIKKYTDKDKLPEFLYDILVENNYPLPEDIKDEKQIDMEEVEMKLRSKKSYIKKWQKVTDKKADKELMQIKLEQQMFEESMLSYDTVDVAGVQDELDQNYTNLSRRDDPNNNRNTNKETNIEEKVDVKEDK